MADQISIERLSGAALRHALPDLARLRITVFQAFPYLYEGDGTYEESYLASYARSDGAVIVAARAPDGIIVGAATAAPLGDHQGQLGQAFRDHGIDPSQVFYLGESVLLPEYRGRGIGHRFFDEREAAGREQGFSLAGFCGVVRPAEHPDRPADYAPLDPFWNKRGYAPIEGLIAPMSWRDRGDDRESEKPMQFWLKRL